MNALTSFSVLGVNPWLVRQCANIGVKKPTDVQVNCIPKILAGLDCIGCSKTGSGKTLSFALPILQKLCEDPFGIFALVITPTRELAYQIGDQFAVLGKMINLRLCVVTGGIEMVDQAVELARKPHVVVATPGRLADHIESCNTFSLKHIKFLVIDEADRLFEGRFNDQLKIIFDVLPKQKQIIMMSATMTDSIENVKKITSKEVFIYSSNSVDNDAATVNDLDQYYVICPSHARDAYLVESVRYFLCENEDESVMVFTDTCKNCQIVSMALNEIGLTNVALHSMLSQKERLASLSRFKSGSVKILIATDVASRGLDIPIVSLVINHILPNDVKTYVHRVGRTARAGRQGTAISIISQYDIALLKAIEEKINVIFKEYRNISDQEVAKIMTQVKVTMREAEIKLDETDFDERKLTNRKKRLILEGRDPEYIEENLRRLRKRMNDQKEKNKKVYGKHSKRNESTAKVKKKFNSNKL